MFPNSSEKKILIVEDEQLIAYSIERSLTKAGYSVPAMAASAEEAFERIEETKPDLVLVDIHIQGERDGVETAKVIRTKYHLPVIYLTAHADADTLERAKVTQPLGYLVKPVNHANLPSSIEMALYKHQADRQVEEGRALLATILSSIAEAVIVTNGFGQVLFLNRAAEILTGWMQSEAVNQDFETIASLDGGSGAPLLLQALTSSRTLQIPRDTTLRTKSGLAVFVDGHIAVSSTEGRAAGAMITLHDATVRRQEEQRLRQEQRMLSVGQMANDIAHDFYGLFDLISSFSEQLTNQDEEQDENAVAEVAAYINRTSSAGVTLARQLVDLGSNQGARPALISLNRILGDRLSAYNHLCGASILVETNLQEGLDLVLNNATHLEKLVLNLLLSAKHSMPYGGKVVISTENVSCPGEKGTAEKQFVSLRFESQRNLSNGAEPSSFLSQPAQNSELTTTVVNAIVAVSEGSISMREQSESVSVTEVLLPAIASVASQGESAPDETRSVVLAVGLAASQGQRLSMALEKRGVVLLQAADAREALLVSGFVEGTVDVLIVNGSGLMPSAQRALVTRIAARWPEVKSLLLAGDGPGASSDFTMTCTRALDPNDLVETAENLLDPRIYGNSTGVGITSLSAALLATEDRHSTAVL